MSEPCCSRLAIALKANAVQEVGGIWYFGESEITHCPMCDSELPRYGEPPRTFTEWGSHPDLQKLARFPHKLKALTDDPRSKDHQLVFDEDGNPGWEPIDG